MNNLAHIYNEGGGCDCAVAETLFSARGASGEAGVVPVRVHPFDPARSALWVTEDGGPCRSSPTRQSYGRAPGAGMALVLVLHRFRELEAS